ncbi:MULTISPECIES: hypothetical protein [unclassified Limnobacter]|jgi:hypothetical protein|uniref:hypothetical protein n=1 Tax=unclassified Limnobacter TaxID=2630203 RepID=UPI0012EF6D84|nr:hypothetical protein [Limnobacter sp. 130]VWX33020.1 conserved hypothetical protein [Limnobacter sp. 130]
MKLVAILALITVGCSSDVPNGNWRATQELQVFYHVNGNEYFTVKTGDICRKGGFSYGKTDRYVEVNCDGKQGWLINDEFLELTQE